jgi:hypothetical protein
MQFEMHAYNIKNMKADEVFDDLSFDWVLINQETTKRGIRNTYKRKGYRYGEPTYITLYVRWKKDDKTRNTSKGGYKLYLESSRSDARVNIMSAGAGDLHDIIKGLTAGHNDHGYGYLGSYGSVYASEGKKYLTQATDMIEKIESISRGNPKLEAVMALASQWPMRNRLVFVK